ncbi:HHL308Wp [Eremothecium sinecaudum]|uniref:HHL308Wp n=1 Tax=Eremothecium sinecaudum TaxID=45286 RepID=A0A0X8HVU6_9SACH|nr:HHL308Wp [Eremothecium sinecaudum]AMD22462.1 HHL308Wp [Eremothecium sinecaudum]
MTLADNTAAEFSQFTQLQIKTLRDAFQLIDDDGDRVISEQDLGKFWQVLGKKPSDDEIKSMLDMGNGCNLTFPVFLSIMSNSLGLLPAENDICEALKIFCKEDDFELNCDIKELKEYVSMAGFSQSDNFDKLVESFTYQTITGEQVFKGKRFLETIGE